jgi:hypothetical protein
MPLGANATVAKMAGKVLNAFLKKSQLFSIPVSGTNERASFRVVYSAGPAIRRGWYT